LWLHGQPKVEIASQLKAEQQTSAGSEIQQGNLGFTANVKQYIPRVGVVFHAIVCRLY